MRLILDTNQVNSLRTTPAPDGVYPVIVVPPMTWAETLGSPHYAVERLHSVAEHNIRFGMDVFTIYERLRELTEDEIAKFDPVYAVDSIEHRRLLAGLLSPTAEHWKRAAELKAMAAQYAVDIQAKIAKSRKRQLDAKSRGETPEVGSWSDIDAADHRVISGPEASYRLAFINDITEGGSLPIAAASGDSLYDAVLRNPALRRFIRTQAIVLFGYAETWGDSLLNVSVAPTRNDFPDIMLTLFARDGDVILVKDGKFRRAFRHGDADMKVGLQTWETWARGDSAA